MLANARPMMCGACGHRHFSVFSVSKDRALLAVECDGCKSVTLIRPSAPQLVFDWGDKAEGILAPAGI